MTLPVRNLAGMRLRVMSRFLLSLLPVLIYSCGGAQPTTGGPPVNTSDLDWKPFTKSVFDDASSQNKLVLLNIGANWCHWCHVMDDSTYSDPEVQDLLNKNFILAREDQDSRADLFSKYRDYGWPAIIVFNAGGEELLKLKGYQPRRKFMADLEKVTANPVVIEEAVEVEAAVAEAVNMITSADDILISNFNQRVDHEKGGFKTFKKSLNFAAVDFALRSDNDSLYAWAVRSVEQSYQLLDPVWGGVYQYATHNDWKTPHYEKILRVQAEYILLYSRKGMRDDDPVAIQNAEKIYNYCNRFLSDNAPLFDNSQDADYKKGTASSAYYSLNETERLKLGTPSVNHKQFLKENAMMALALSELWIATANQKYLYRAKLIVDELLKDFECENRLYAREKNSCGIYSLEDNIAFVQALVRAYQLTGNTHYTGKANDIANALLAEFKTASGQLASSAGDIVVEPAILSASNYQAAITLHQLGDILKQSHFTTTALDILYASYRHSFDSSEYVIPYVLASNKATQEEAFHAVWISDKTGTKTELEFVRHILKYAEEHVIIDRVDVRNMTEEQQLLYGSAEPNTLFMCTSSFCSSPMTTIDQLSDFFGVKKKPPGAVLNHF